MHTDTVGRASGVAFVAIRRTLTRLQSPLFLLVALSGNNTSNTRSSRAAEGQARRRRGNQHELSPHKGFRQLPGANA